MNELVKPFRKKSYPKNRKTEDQSEIAACEQKTTSKKAISLFKHHFLTLLLEHTQQNAGKQPPLIPITLLGLKEKKISTKIDFCIKTF